MRWHFDFMGASRWFFSMSGVILLVGALALATQQLNFGIDFESGTRIKVALTKTTDEEGVRDTLDAAGIDGERGPAGLRSSARRQRLPDPDPSAGSEPGRGGCRKRSRRSTGSAENGFDSTSVGPTFGEQVANSARKALIFSLLVICAYVAFRFDPKFAVPVLIAIFHDILITAGVYSLTGREVTSGTVAAFLTILGYSLYDTIIVFDRIRENMPRMPRAAFSQIVNRSMSEVLTRSLATSFSTLLAVVSLLIFGGATLQDFAFAMMVGILSGTYSSIFIASPVLTAWKEREPGFVRRRERIAAIDGQRARPSPTRSSWRGSAKTARRPTWSWRRRSPRKREEQPKASAVATVEPSRRRRRRRALEQRRAARRRSGGRGSARARRATARTSSAASQTREEALEPMALLVWFTMGIALWHFTVFLPDRFWQGIVGAFLGATIGAVLFGAIVETAAGNGLGDTDVLTALTAIPGTAIGLAVVWVIGVREERAVE